VIKLVVYITRKAEFCASHFYRSPHLTEEENRKVFGEASNPHGHGHNYILEITVKGEVDEKTGMVVNLTEIEKIIQNHIMPYYDHRNLNLENPAFKNGLPSSENMAKDIWRIVSESLNVGAQHATRAQQAAPKGTRHAMSLHKIMLQEDSTFFVEYLGGDMHYLTRIYEFSVAHRLHNIVLSDEENRELYGKCNSPYGHGHNYFLELTVKGEIDPKTGMIVDLGYLDQIVKETVLSRFDHKYLNLDTVEFKELNPTSENFVKVIWELLEPELKGAKLHKLRLRETSKNYFEYYGE
jgi:6-pyruvoyltetrahydropterin/6-carboxytetrahydropterin synthase